MVKLKYRIQNYL